jgi:putative tricarboxylic transport membrane protein
MMETLHGLYYGFSLAVMPQYLFYAFIGCIIGTFIGVLPGLGPATTIAVLLPITYQTGSPLASIIMLSAIFYGAMYGGSTTSILLRVPGEAASVVTMIDGYEMAKQGRAGPALAIAAIGSFFAGTVAIVGLTFVGPTFAAWALRFGPPEYFALATFGLILASTLGGTHPLRSVAMALAGLLFGLIGTDVITGMPRFTMGSLRLVSGLDIVSVMMGLIGVGEILYMLEQKGAVEFAARKIGKLMPSREEWQASTGPMTRGTVIGFIIGLIPGGGAILAAMLSYMAEKRFAKNPETMGRGNIAGVAGPEAANNAAASSSFIPLLTLGLPSNGVSAVLLAALMIQNVQPGPLMLTRYPDVFWGVIASMYVGNVMLLVLNLPLVGLWVQLLRVPFWILGPAVIAIAAMGSYSLSNDFFDVGVLAASGLVGCVLRKAEFDPSPFVIAFLLSGMVDTSLRQSLLMNDGNPLILVTRPISGGLLAVALLYLAALIYSRRGKLRLIPAGTSAPAE